MGNLKKEIIDGKEVVTNSFVWTYEQDDDGKWVRVKAKDEKPIDEIWLGNERNEVK